MGEAAMIRYLGIGIGGIPPGGGGIIGFGGMAGIPKRAKAIEEKLHGLVLADTGSWQAAADAVKEDFTPLTDLRASAVYRSRVAANLVVKALAEIAGLSTQVTRVVDHRTLAHAAE